ncbi:methylated-DNA--protein-cysteine methyltransferase isoform X2 [Synchiropus splendidus]|uniref:methylated-DNA--protein-cysteine methyltransferase isoform X2 n=1 Tax=Synchiropus splendidus TaxID=270530 RepID=UPI00237E0BBF|nr:methylated-DNA--protein-cysteine methyltransferase isoform X2 [Synchiropus splendidus]
MSGSEMKKQRESRCTQKTISLLSPLGKIQVSGCENGVHTIQILMDVAPAERSGEAPLSCVVNDSPAEMSPELQRCIEWLQAYFSEPQTTGSLQLPSFHHPALQGDSFTSRVLRLLLRDVKFGETVSYKRLAEMAGNPKAVRAVGGAMRRNPLLVQEPIFWRTGDDKKQPRSNMVSQLHTRGRKQLRSSERCQVCFKSQSPCCFLN